MTHAESNPRGIFINPPKANCSIYESGRMMYDCLALSSRYQLDYMEIDEYSRAIPNSYDFYAFNYHHVRMAWLDTKSVRRLPGVKLTFVLETLPNDPFVLCPRDDFDAYCALDPTMTSADTRVFGFPRPLEFTPELPPYQEPEIPVIGTFGFATRGKGFERVVEAVNREFEHAVVRINIPPSEFSYRKSGLRQRKEYGETLVDLCRKTAKNGIEVRVTRTFMSKPELIRWCAENTLNCFLYDRRQPGLSATTDQAIASGRPLAIGENQTFRHILSYCRPYPARSLKESIDVSIAEVRRMQNDWAPIAFARRFESVIEELGLFAPTRPARPENQILHLELKPPPDTAAIRFRRLVRKARFFAEDYLTPAPKRETLCKFLSSRAEMRAGTRYLSERGFTSHRLACKDWDIANILQDLSPGNLLDMGSSDSFLLKNVVAKGLAGEKYGIDLQRPDVPVDGVHYVIGDLTKTGLQDGMFQNVTCLSVIEHGVDFAAFAREAARLLAQNGKLYVTFDYWSPKVTPRLKVFGIPWNILDEGEVRRLVDVCRGVGLVLASDIDWTIHRPIIGPWNYSPDPTMSYTFGLLTFCKKTPLERHEISPEEQT